MCVFVLFYVFLLCCHFVFPFFPRVFFLLLFSFSFPCFSLLAFLFHFLFEKKRKQKNNRKNIMKRNASKRHARCAQHRPTTRVLLGTSKKYGRNIKTLCIGLTSSLLKEKGFKFYQTRSNAIILYDTLPAYCIPKVVRMETGEIIYTPS